MTYKLINPNDGMDALDGAIAHPSVYLGGNCRGRDWRHDIFRKFERANVTFINPKRDTFPDPEDTPVEHAEQVLWERKAIEAADVSLFWLGEGLANQASRVEIGYAIGLGKKVIIGAEPGFLGLEHLSAFSGLVLSSSLEGLMTRLESLVYSSAE